MEKQKARTGANGIRETFLPGDKREGSFTVKRMDVTFQTPFLLRK